MYLPCLFSGWTIPTTGGMVDAAVAAVADDDNNGQNCDCDSFSTFVNSFVLCSIINESLSDRLSLLLLPSTQVLLLCQYKKNQFPNLQASLPHH